MMNALLVAVLVAGMSPAFAGSKPQKVMSINQCTDQLVLVLLPKARKTPMRNEV